MRKSSFHQNTGFTLIELMVAIAIVAVLATIGIVAFGATQKSARDAKRKGDLEDIKKALYLYRSAKGTFCIETPCNASLPFGETTYRMSASTLETILNRELGPYIKGGKFPIEPGGVASHYQLKNIDNDNFEIYAVLENPPSPSTLTGCILPGGTSSINYCIGE